MDTQMRWQCRGAWWDKAAAVPAPYPALPPSPSPFPASASTLRSFAGALLPSHAAAALWSDQAGGHPRGLGVCWTTRVEDRTPLLPPQALLLQPVALLPLPGTDAGLGGLQAGPQVSDQPRLFKGKYGCDFAKEELHARVLLLSDERYIPGSPRAL